MTPGAPLPIDDVLDQIAQQLRSGNRLVITAPPGAGKTTRVPLHLLDQGFLGEGKLILVEPRRIAARAAAERMARSLGEHVGQTIGLRARMDVKVSKVTRVEVVTEGVFNRIILSDPALEGVAIVVFDEFHERSLDADEGMAFALDAQSVLRDDLALVVMSATLPPRLTDTYFQAPIIKSDGRAHPVETRYLGYTASDHLEDQVAAAIRKAINDETGSILAFLPGAAEIRRTMERLEPAPPGVQLCPLYGALSQQEQSAAIAPPPPGVRKVVIATDIAESAITIEGVRVVVDSGFARVPRFDPSLGATRLETTRIARANADQRRGRAGRTQAGVCYRLWREAEMGGFAEAPSPEIEQADLTGLCLDMANWGARSPSDLPWLTPPRPAAWDHAKATLIRHGALDEAGAPTAIGKQLGDLPVAPRLGLMILNAARTGDAQTATRIAALLSERDLGGRSTDIRDRLHRLDTTSTPRERAMRDLATRWEKLSGNNGKGFQSPGAILAAAFPDRIARSRPNAHARYQLASGRGAFLDPADPLANSQWLIAADIAGAGPDVRITLAAPLDQSELESLALVETTETATFDHAAMAVRARRRKHVGAIQIEDTPLPAPRPETTRNAVIAAIRRDGLSLLPHSETLSALAQRIEFLYKIEGDKWPADFESLLLDRLDDWLPALPPNSRLEFSSSTLLYESAIHLLAWPLPRDLETLAPATWTPPAGSPVAIDYSDPDSPRASCKLQQVFGPEPHPVIAKNIPITLFLLSPANRPIAVTRDLPRFWTEGYADVRKDMKGRYAKHFWPDDPSASPPSARSIRTHSSF